MSIFSIFVSLHSSFYHSPSLQFSLFLFSLFFCHSPYILTYSRCSFCLSVSQDDLLFICFELYFIEKKKTTKSSKLWIKFQLHKRHRNISLSLSIFNLSPLTQFPLPRVDSGLPKNVHQNSCNRNLLRRQPQSYTF